MLKKKESYYSRNKERIKLRVKNRIQSESPEEKERRLAFHRKYNAEHSTVQRIRTQTDEYKFKLYIHSAKKRNHTFELSFEDFKEVFHGKCDYCGKEDSRGVDRVKNLIGYTKENSVPCCAMCNKMKWRYSKEEFLNQIKKISINLSI